MLFKFSTHTDFVLKREDIRILLREFSPDDSEMLYISLNEAVNNAFIHGYPRDSKYKPVEIELYQENDELIIKVRQEGIGIGQQKNKDANQANEKKEDFDIWQENGRGLFIISNCFDYSQFDKDGTELIMRKKLSK